MSSGDSCPCDFCFKITLISRWIIVWKKEIVLKRDSLNVKYISKQNFSLKTLPGVNANEQDKSRQTDCVFHWKEFEIKERRRNNANCFRKLYAVQNQLYFYYLSQLKGAFSLKTTSAKSFNGKFLILWKGKCQHRGKGVFEATSTYVSVFGNTFA